jgi:methylase of polypeptide subunit release factors
MGDTMAVILGVKKETSVQSSRKNTGRQSHSGNRLRRRGTRSRTGAGSGVAGVPSSNASTLEKLRELLASSGYIASGIDPDNSYEGAPGNPLNKLLRLFHWEEGVVIEEAASALSPLTIEQLVKAGFLRRQGKRVFSKVHIQAYRDLLFAFPIDETECQNTVMLISPTSTELDKITVRRHSGKTLDLGTGCGVQAMLAARHSDLVLAVDLNPRAISFAELNCRWNRIPNVTFLRGSFLEPVCDQRFDLIVCNPPFVISPAARLMYRDLGGDGDTFCIQLARDAARLLNDGGYFQMCFQWIEMAGTDWRKRLLQSFSGVGCDVLILREQMESPEAHVRAWMKENEAESYSQWMRYLASREAASVGTGFCIMKRVTGRTPFAWFDDAPDENSEEYGDDIARMFSIRAHMEGCSDSDLLQQRLVASPQLRLLQVSRCSADSWQPTATEFLLDQGLKYVSGGVDSVLAGLVSACNGQRTIQEVFETVALQNHSSTQNLISKYLSQVRELAHYAFLIPGGFMSAQDPSLSV